MSLSVRTNIRPAARAVAIHIDKLECMMFNKASVRHPLSRRPKVIVPCQTLFR
jgi:hypothetical protein